MPLLFARTERVLYVRCRGRMNNCLLKQFKLVGRKSLFWCFKGRDILTSEIIMGLLALKELDTKRKSDETFGLLLQVRSIFLCLVMSRIPHCIRPRKSGQCHNKEVEPPHSTHKASLHTPSKYPSAYSGPNSPCQARQHIASTMYSPKHILGWRRVGK